MNTIQGKCYCGAVRFELTLPTKFCSHCHCEDCRQTHGSAFVTWTGVAQTQFKLLSDANKLRKYESHPGIRWGFCGDCGTSLFYENDETPDYIDIVVSSLIGPLDREPKSHVSFEERVPWIKIKDDLPRYRGKTKEEISD